MRLLVFIFVLSMTSIAQQSKCDYGVEILIDGDEFDSKDFAWKMKATKIEGGSTIITGTAKIEDSDGKLVKSYKPWTSETISRQKTSSEYTPNLKPGNYEITAEVDVECDDGNKGNDVNTKRIKINGQIEKKTAKEPNNKKDESDDEKEDITTINKKPENRIAVPKQTIQQSNEEEANTINLRPSNKEVTNTQPQASAIKNTETVYESSNEKAKGLIMVFLLSLSILLNIVLIWKR